MLNRQSPWASCTLSVQPHLCQIMPVYEHTDRRKTQDINKPQLGACVIRILRMSSMLDKTQWRNRFCYKNFRLLNPMCSSSVCYLHDEVSGRPAVCVRSVFCVGIFWSQEGWRIEIVHLLLWIKGVWVGLAKFKCRVLILVSLSVGQA